MYGGTIIYLPYSTFVPVFHFMYNFVITIYISLPSHPVIFTKGCTILHFQHKNAGFLPYMFTTKFYQFCQSFSFCWYSVQMFHGGLNLPSFDYDRERLSFHTYSLIFFCVWGFPLLFCLLGYRLSNWHKRPQI